MARPNSGGDKARQIQELKEAIQKQKEISARRPNDGASPMGGQIEEYKHQIRATQERIAALKRQKRSAPSSPLQPPKPVSRTFPAEVYEAIQPYLFSEPQMRDVGLPAGLGGTHYVEDYVVGGSPSAVLHAPVYQEPIYQEPIHTVGSYGGAIRGPRVDRVIVGEPYVDEPYVEAPYVEAPYVEAPYVEAPYVEAPYVEAPYVEAPYVEAPLIIEEGPSYLEPEVVYLDGGMAPATYAEPPVYVSGAAPPVTVYEEAPPIVQYQDPLYEEVVVQPEVVQEAVVPQVKKTRAATGRVVREYQNVYLADGTMVQREAPIGSALADPKVQRSLGIPQPSSTPAAAPAPAAAPSAEQQRAAQDGYEVVQATPPPPAQQPAAPPQPPPAAAAAAPAAQTVETGTDPQSAREEAPLPAAPAPSSDPVALAARLDGVITQLSSTQGRATQSQSVQQPPPAPMTTHTTQTPPPQREAPLPRSRKAGSKQKASSLTRTTPPKNKIGWTPTGPASQTHHRATVSSPLPSRPSPLKRKTNPVFDVDTIVGREALRKVLHDPEVERLERLTRESRAIRDPGQYRQNEGMELLAGDLDQYDDPPYAEDVSTDIDAVKVGTF